MARSLKLHFRNPKESSILRDLTFTPELLSRMRPSLHPPHVVEERAHETLTGRTERAHEPNAAFPFCWYDDKLDAGTGGFGGYNETYCDSFQVQ